MNLSPSPFPLAIAFAALSAASLPLSAAPALTIYNQNFAVVRETIPLALDAGVNMVNFSGVTTQVEPNSVVLRDADGKIDLSVLEQSYRADAASEGLLLSLNEGKTIDFIVTNDDGHERTVKGRIIRSGYKASGSAATPIIEVGGQLRFSLPGKPVFPTLGDSTILQPTLSWQIASPKKAKLQAELGYLTNGLSWLASYNFIAPEKGDQVDVVGWVTVENRSGKTFEDASIKLMAGDVNRATAIRYPAPAMLAMRAQAPQGDVTEKAFDEFHLYSLPRAVTLRDQETKQVEFLRASGIHAPQLYIFDAQKYGDKIATVREFKNTRENGGLGLPLPKGITRFYRQDGADGRLEFVGENTIQHVAKNETVRIYTGNVFDIVAERKQTDSQQTNFKKQREEAFEITLRNRKEDGVEIRVTEHFAASWRNWEIIEQSDPWEKLDSESVEFRVKLKPDEEKKVNYRVRYDWQ